MSFLIKPFPFQLLLFRCSVILEQWARDQGARDGAGARVANLLLQLGNGFATCGGIRLEDFLTVYSMIAL